MKSTKATDKHAPRKPSGKYTPQEFLEKHATQKERKKAEQRRGEPPPSAHVDSQRCPFTGVCDCYRAVEQEGYILAEIVNPSVELCLAAVRENGMVLRYVSEAEQFANPEICAAAIKQCSAAVKYSSISI